MVQRTLFTLPDPVLWSVWRTFASLIIIMGWWELVFLRSWHRIPSYHQTRRDWRSWTTEHEFHQSKLLTGAVHIDCQPILNPRSIMCSSTKLWSRRAMKHWFITWSCFTVRSNQMPNFLITTAHAIIPPNRWFWMPVSVWSQPGRWEQLWVQNRTQQSISIASGVTKRAEQQWFFPSSLISVSLLFSPLLPILPAVGLSWSSRTTDRWSQLFEISSARGSLQ